MRDLRWGTSLRLLDFNRDAIIASDPMPGRSTPWGARVTLAAALEMA